MPTTTNSSPNKKTFKPGQEIDLMINYPRTKRNVEERGNEKTPEDRAIARKFGKEFFDGDRKTGYGGFNYMSRFWQPVIPTFQKHWNLKSGDSVLDVGCAKGFMLYDFTLAIPGIKVGGIDVSEYAIENSKPEVKQFLKVADARDLPYEDKSFDVVISVTTVHNLEYDDCITALKEIERVSRILCPPEAPAIVANAGNGPIEYIARRTRTAASRATFQPEVLQASRQLHMPVASAM